MSLTAVSINVNEQTEIDEMSLGELKRHTKTQLELVIVYINIDKCKSTDFRSQIQFGCNESVLDSIKKPKEDSCYGCHQLIMPKQGKNCMLLNCIHPNDPDANKLQWHTYCLIPSNYSVIILC